MATFKVGQRVRVVDRDSTHYGMEAVIAGSMYFTATRRVSTGERSPAHWTYPIAIAGRRSPAECGFWYVAPEDIAPLTDGESDAWATDAVRKATKPQHIEPVAPGKVTV